MDMTCYMERRATIPSSCGAARTPLFLGLGDDFIEVRPDGRPDQIWCGPGTDRLWWLVRHERHDRAIGCELVRTLESRTFDQNTP